MANSEINPEILDRIKALEEKYRSTGQDLASYLDGLLHSDYLTYWDYIHTDALLSLQIPRTNFPDEMIFIIYHQTTELYFKMILSEIHQIAYDKEITGPTLLKRINRSNRYIKILIDSFEVMVEGMDPEQFTKFRMSLMPASGFQSAQFRMIEIASTDLINIVKADLREELKSASLEEMFNNIYWKQGATELATGNKTVTLKQFEEKYGKVLLRLVNEFQDRNIRKVYNELKPEEKEDKELIDALKEFDVNINVRWPLMHYKSAVKYLHRKPEAIAATGGTNWQKYLAPKIQRRIFFPELWTDEELENWGMSKILEL